MLAGALAAAPLVIVVSAAVWLERETAPLARAVGIRVPGMGVLVALVLVYLLGLFVTSLVGGLLLGWIDRVVRRVPGLAVAYQAWREVWATPLDKPGVWSRVVLVPSEGEGNFEIGFTSGEPLPADPRALTVFVPEVANPLAGRLVVADRASVRPLDVSAHEAFKLLLSRGNYVPPDLRRPSPPGST
jgi:uncharacterized membrane protein